MTHKISHKDPHGKDDFEHLPPEQLAEDIIQKELRIVEIMREVKDLLERKPSQRRTLLA